MEGRSKDEGCSRQRAQSREMLRWRTENLFKELPRKKVAIVMKKRNKDRKIRKLIWNGR